MRSGYIKHLEKAVSTKKAKQAITAVAPETLAIAAVSNRTKALKPTKSHDHPYATMSKKAYQQGKDRNIFNYDIDNELSRDDITVYKHKLSNDVVLAFRGTDLSTKVERKPVKSISDIWYSRGFRDIFADASLAAYSPEYNHRFYNYKKTTQDAIKKYGHSNVKVTGHSLGGSGALWISNELDVKAVAHNPFIHPIDAALGTAYSNAVIRANPGDPISVAAPFANAKIEMGAPSSRFQHGIENWVEKEKGMTTFSRPPPPKDTNVYAKE